MLGPKKVPTMKSLGGSSDKKTSKAVELESVVAEVEAPIDFSKVDIEPFFEDCVDFETFSKSDFRAVKVKECVAVPKSKKLLQFTLDDGTGTDRTILSGIHNFYELEEVKLLERVQKNMSPEAMQSFCPRILSLSLLDVVMKSLLQIFSREIE